MPHTTLRTRGVEQPALSITSVPQTTHPRQQPTPWLPAWPCLLLRAGAPAAGRRQIGWRACWSFLIRLRGCSGSGSGWGLHACMHACVRQQCTSNDVVVPGLAQDDDGNGNDGDKGNVKDAVLAMRACLSWVAQALA
eukprot:1161521-Pelagomonas_calceolata.AAC.7